jgi:ribosomal protein S18 acetylase RimI-like enzyme
MRIRQFKPKDYKDMIKVLNSVGSYHQDTNNYKVMMRVCRQSPDLFLVAEDKGKIIGTVLGQAGGSIGFIWSLAVLPKEQGKGIGKALMKEIEKRLKKKGCVGIDLFTSLERKKAVNMYNKMGYKHVKKAYVMAKKSISFLGP